MDFVSVFQVFGLLDWKVFGALLVLSVIYAFLLQLWCKHWPESFSDNTWVTVFIGVGYVLGGLGFLLDWQAWLRVCAAFVFAGGPIIVRSLVNHARRRRAANGYWEGEDRSDGV